MEAQSIKRLEASHGSDDWFAKALEQDNARLNSPKPESNSTRLIVGVNSAGKPTTK